MPASVTAALSVECQIGRGGSRVVAGIGCQGVESCELHAGLPSAIELLLPGIWQIIT